MIDALTLYIVRDSTGAAIAGPYAVRQDAQGWATILTTDHPPAYVTAHYLPAIPLAEDDPQPLHLNT